MKKTKRNIFLVLSMLVASQLSAQQTFPKGSSTLTSCGVSVVDAGGANDYPDGDGTLTLQPSTAGKRVKVDFTMFDLNGEDALTVYDGTSTSLNNLIGTFRGNTLPSSLIAGYANTSGALTLVFMKSPFNVGSITNKGFAFDVSCVNPELTVPTKSQQTVTTCDAKIYDAGGSTGAYQNGSDGVLVISPAQTGKKVKLAFDAFLSEKNVDVLYVFDGENTSAELIGAFSGSTLPPSIAAGATNTSGKLTLKFETSNANVMAGFSLSSTCVSEVTGTLLPGDGGKQTITACEGMIFDEGGSTGNYYRGSYGTLVVKPGVVGKSVRLAFESFETDAEDNLRVYDGLDNNSPLLGTFSGATLPGTLTATSQNTSGALTITFSADNFIEERAGGFAAKISCVTPEYTFPIGGTYTLPVCGITVHNAGGSENTFPTNHAGAVLVKPTSTGQKATVIFNRFNLTKEDYLYVYDGETINARLIAKFNGNTLPPQVTATEFNASGALLLKFQSYTKKEDRPDARFTFTTSCAPSPTVRVVPTGGELVLYQVEKLSPCGSTVYDMGGGENYANNVDGAITFYSGTLGQKLKIDFTSFNTEKDMDLVRIYRGYGTSSEVLLATYSGSTLPPSFVSPDNLSVLTVRFTSNQTVTASGFAFKVSCLPNTVYINNNEQKATVCESKFSDGPNNYSNNLNYVTTLTPQETGKKLKIVFDEFELEEKDILWIYDGPTTNSPILARYTGVLVPPSVVASSKNTTGELTVQFTTNASNVSKGFLFHTLCVDQPEIYSFPVLGTQTITTCNALLLDNGGEVGNYEDNSDATVTIKPAKVGDKIRIDFNLFDVEAADRIYIYDGLTTSSNSLDNPCCGSNVTSVVASKSNTSGALTLRFVSNALLNHEGFKITVACNSQLTGMDDKFIVNGEEAYRFFPNPTEGYVQIAHAKSEMLHMEVYNSQGEKIAEQIVETNQRISTSQLPQGLYWINLLDGRQVVHAEKVVIK